MSDTGHTWSTPNSQTLPELGVDATTAEHLAGRVDALDRRLRARARSRTRRRNMTLLLGGGLAALSAFMLFRLTTQSRELDTDALAQIARTNIEPELPGARATLEDNLKAQAPDAVRGGVQALVDAMPSLRAHLTKGLSEKFDRLNADVEQKVQTLAAETIRQTKADLDKRHPNMGDAEKLEMLANEVSAKLRTAVPEALDAMYPEYAAELTRLRKEVEDLYKRDPSELTREEKIKRELVQTAVRLVQRELNDEAAVQAAAPAK